jgi:hypothetical protein
VLRSRRARYLSAQVDLLFTTVAGLAAGVFNCAFLLSGLRSSPLDPVISLISELEARDQPGGGWFRWASLLAGAAAVVFAAGLSQRLPPGRLGLAGCWAVAVFGLAGMADALMPMDCAPSVDEVCRRQEAGGALSWMHEGHTWSSVVGIVGLLVSMSLLGWHLRHHSGWRLASLVGLVGCAALSAWSAIVSVMTIEYLPTLGLAQRIQVLAIAAWMAVLALEQARQPVIP